MVECDYCDATFEDEDSYLAHLRDAHEGELGSIDQRRVDDLDSDSGSPIPTGPAVLGLVLVVGLGLVAYLTLFAGSGGGGATDLPNRGDQAVISQVQDEPSSGNDHVEEGTDIDYERTPPTGGTHYFGVVEPGFYEEPQSYGLLVHSLEHGHIVVYYDPEQLSPEAEENLQSYAQTHTGTWEGFIAVPNPEDDPEATYVLTAWEKRLTMDEYDPETVRQFTAEFIGRGPENPVRPR